MYERPAVIGSPCSRAIFTVPPISTDGVPTSAAAGMSIHCSEPGITSALRAAPPLFFSTGGHLLRGRCLRTSRSCQQQAQSQHTNSLFRRGFISSVLQVLTLYFVTGPRAVLPQGGD